MRRAILKGSLLLPIERLPAPDAVIRRMTVSLQPSRDDPVQTIHAYAHVDGNYLEVPRQYGIELCKRHNIEIEDQTAKGKPARFPRVPEYRDYQVEPMAEVKECADNFYDFLFRARTGFGKTISMLRFAAERGRNTLVLVDQENLRDQWIEALITHFGFALEDIGIIQGKRCDYKDKAVTIAMVQTLSRGRHEYAEILHYFGTLIVDEVDAIGAPTFSMVLFDVAAEVRIGISATPKRTDDTQRLLAGHLGEVRVASDAQHEKSRVYFVRSYGVYSWYANVASKAGRFLTEIADDGARNLVMMEIMHWLYQTGRDVLILSDRIEQLRHLMDLAYYMGVPEEDTGLYTGRDVHYRVAKDPLPETDAPGERSVPSRLQLISKAIPKKQLALVKDAAKMIFATYPMFKKGVDVPRLAGGVDATPRSRAEQIHGRILRGGSGKESIWITVVDWNSYRSVHNSIQRMKDFAKSNAEIHEWLEEGGSQSWSVVSYVKEAKRRVDQLKSMEIRTYKDGRHQLVKLTSDEKLRHLQQGQQFRDHLLRQRGETAGRSISASERNTRMIGTTANIVKGSRGTATGSRIPPRLATSPAATLHRPARRGR